MPDSEKDQGSIVGKKAVDEVLATLSRQQLYLLLQRVRDWNANARTSPVAQRILNCLLKSYPASVWVEMGKSRKLGGMKDLLRALEVYTERHYRRMEDLVDESFLVEFTLREMDEVGGGVLGLENGNGERDVVMT